MECPSSKFLQSWREECDVNHKAAFSKFDGKEYVSVKMIAIGPKGRAVDDPVLVGDTYVPGRYEFLLHVDDYFTKTKAQLPSVPFLHKVPVRFQVVNASQRIHLPIQFGPWSYTYSRGS
jgi:5-hydroxyisourate hydrolase